MSDLSVQQLKEYLKNVFDLEGALYQHNQLVAGYTTRRRENLPPEPVKGLPTPPAKPIPRHVPAYGEVKATPTAIVLTILFCITGFFGFFFLIMPIVEGGNGVGGGMFLCGLVLAPFSIFCFIGARKDGLSQIEEVKEKNQEDYQKYEQEMEEYRTAVAKVNEKYFDKMEKYAQKLADYNRETNAQLQRFDEVKATLQTSLTKLYSQNIVYAKYRNLVAMATIYEYFDSGRCTELEGPNGAYNMYEGELRSSIIISSLSQIVSDLGQIKNGQYALYEQICRSNEKVTQILDNIYNAQILTAYYAEAAAIAASADRITYSVIL